MKKKKFAIWIGDKNKIDNSLIETFGEIELINEVPEYCKNIRYLREAIEDNSMAFAVDVIRIKEMSRESRLYFDVGYKVYDDTFFKKYDGEFLNYSYGPFVGLGIFRLNSDNKLLKWLDEFYSTASFKQSKATINVIASYFLINKYGYKKYGGLKVVNSVDSDSEVGLIRKLTDSTWSDKKMDKRNYIKPNTTLRVKHYLMYLSIRYKVFRFLIRDKRAKSAVNFMDEMWKEWKINDKL